MLTKYTNLLLLLETKNMETANKISTTVQVGVNPHLYTLGKTNSLVNVILHVMTAGKCKDKDAVIKEVVALCAKYNVKVTKQKTTVTPKNARSLLGAIMRDINKQRKGWWSLYKVVAEKNRFCFEAINTNKVKAVA